MPLTRGALQSRLQSTLADITSVYFTPQMIQASIQDGYDEIVCASECIEQLTNMPWVSNLVYYDIYDIVSQPSYWKPTRLFNYATNRWLPVVDSRFLDKYRWDWEMSDGTPWFAYVVNWQFIGFFPHYHAAVTNFDLYYKVCPDILTGDGSIIQIPDPHSKALENWCTADLLMAIQEFDKAADYKLDAKNGIDELKTQVKRRMSPQFYAQLNDLQFPLPTLP
jgi:hypothetical protein